MLLKTSYVLKKLVHIQNKDKRKDILPWKPIDNLVVTMETNTFVFVKANLLEFVSSNKKKKKKKSTFKKETPNKEILRHENFAA